MDMPQGPWPLTPTEEMFVRFYSKLRRDLERYDRELLSKADHSPVHVQVIEEFVRGAVELGNNYLATHKRIGQMAYQYVWQ